MSNDTKTAKGGGGGSNQDIAQSGFFQEFFAEELKPNGDAIDAGKPSEKSQPASGATGDATEAPKDGETPPTTNPADGEKPLEGGKPPADPASGGGEQKPEGDKPKPKARAQTIAEEALGIDAPDSDAGTQDAPSQAAPVSVGDVAAVAAEAAVRAVGKVRSEAATEPTPKPGDDGLTDEVRRHQLVYEELSRQNPKKYTDIAKRLSKFQQAERAYADAWERENPGSVFNADDTQHAKWYASNSVAVDREDFDDARISVRAREIVSREVQPKQAAMEREMERSRVEPEAHHAGQSVAAAIFEAVTQKPLTPEAARALPDQDPAAAEVALAVDARFTPVARIIPLMYAGLVDTSKPDVAPIANAARQMLGAFEADLQSTPKAALVRDGKAWVPLSTFYGMSAADRAKHWAVGPGDIVKYVSRAASAEAKRLHKEHESRLERLATARGWVKPAAQNTEQVKPQAADGGSAPSQAPSAGKTTSPSPGVSKVVGAAREPSTQEPVDPLAAVWKSMRL